MAIAKLSIDLEARLTKLEAGLKQATSMAEKSAGQMQKAFSGLALTFTGLAGALSIGALKGAFDKYVDGAASMQKLAVITGSTTEKISGLSAVARLSGTDVGALEGGMVRLSAALTKADKESSSAGKAFATLELDPAKLRTMDTADALQAVAKSFAQIEDGSSKTALAVALFGKAGAELLPYLNDLANTGNLVAKITTEQGQAAKDYQVALRQLEASQGAVAKIIVGELVPSASMFVKELVALIQQSNGVKDAITGMARDGSIKSWANDAAIGAARVVDIFRTLKIAAEGVAIGISLVAKTIQGIGTVASIGLSSASFDVKRQAYADYAAGARKDMEDLDKRVSANLQAGHGSASAFTDRIKGAINGQASDRFLSARAAMNAVDHPTKRKIQFAGEGDGVSAGGGGGKSRAAKEADDGARLVESLRDQVRNTQHLTELEKLESQIADGKYKTASAANIEIAKGYAQTLDNINASRTEAEAELEVQRKRLEVFADGARVMESVRTPVEALDAEIAHLVTLLGDGAISMETFGRAASKAGEQFQAIESDAETTSKGLSAFAKSAAKNMQTAFADFLFDPFEKGTQSMLQSFGETVRRMVANAVSADLMNRLFGDLGKQGGSVGGLVGKGLDWLSKILSVAGGGGGFSAEDFANLAASHIDSAKGNVFSSPALSAYSGSVVSRPTIFPFARGVGLMGEAGPEAILPLSRGSDGKLGVRGGGHSVSVIINMGNNSGAADVRRSGGAVAREVLGALSAAGRYR